MLFEKYLGKQLAHPSGIFSGFVARGMNRGNAFINQMTVQFLDIKPADRVLEIGFGGGGAIEEMTNYVQSGLVAGIDISDAMVRRGKKNFERIIAQGKLELKEGNASKIPYEDGFFDKVCTVNCIYFWSEPVTCLKEISRILKNKGTLIISFVPKEDLEQKVPPARHGFTFYTDDQLRKLLDEADFENIRIEHREHRPLNTAFAIANKR